MIELKTFNEYPELAAPRRLRKYVLVYCSKGTATVMADEMVLKLSKNDLTTITSGQVHHINVKPGTKGFVLEFTYDFFCKNDADIELVFQNGLFCHFDRNEVVSMNDDAIEKQLETIRQELSRMPYQYMITVHSRIELILVAINRAKLDRGYEIWKPDALFLKFLEAVRAGFDNPTSLQGIAKQLNTSEAKLNELARAHTGRTAQNVIYGLVASEAKRLLTYQNLSVKEVAYQLGFNDPFYFSNFFKKHTRMSPKFYQEKYAV